MKLGLSLFGSTQMPVKTLNTLESQLRDLLKILSHADIFSYAAYRHLSLERTDPPMLKRIRESLSVVINHLVSFASYLIIEVLQSNESFI